MLEGNTKGAILVVTYERWHTTTYIGVSGHSNGQMSKPLKVLLRTTIVTTLLIVLIGIVVYWKISTEWKDYFSEKEIQQIADEISTSEKLDPVFYGIWDRLHNNDRHKSVFSITSRRVISDILFGEFFKETAWQVAVGYYFPKNGIKNFGDYKLGFGLENFVTPEKCFDYVISKDYELIEKTGNIWELNEPSLLKDTTEILEFITVINAPTLYRDKELLDKRVEELKAELNGR